MGIIKVNLDLEALAWELYQLVEDRRQAGEILSALESKMGIELHFTKREEAEDVIRRYKASKQRLEEAAKKLQKMFGDASEALNKKFADEWYPFQGIKKL